MNFKSKKIVVYLLFLILLLLCSCSNKIIPLETKGTNEVQNIVEEKANNKNSDTGDLEIGDYYTLSIVNTHDIHGNDENLPVYATLIKQARSEAKNLLVLDGGDFFKGGQFWNLQGIPEMEMLNLMDYDAWVLGNHEFTVPFDNATAEDCNKQLNAITSLSKGQPLCANVKFKDGSYLDNVLPYMIKVVNGVKVGIIGITSTKPQDREMDEVSDKIFYDPNETLINCIEDLEGKTDINILLSHTGLSVDDKMLYNYIDDDWKYGYKLAAILGADDH